MGRIAKPIIVLQPRVRQREFPGKREKEGLLLAGESGHMFSWQAWIITADPVSVQLPHPSKWDLWETGRKTELAPSVIANGCLELESALLTFPLVSSLGGDAQWASNTGGYNMSSVCILQASKSGLVLKGTCWLKKNIHNPQSWELYFICWEFLGLQAQKTIYLNLTPRELLQEGREEPGYVKFLQKDRWCEHQKIVVN